MQRKSKRQQFIIDIRKLVLFLFALTWSLLLLSHEGLLFASGAVKDQSLELSDSDLDKLSSKLEIYFENAYVQSGVPLRVLGAPNDTTYQWVITDAGGNENKFITKDNTYTPTEKDLEKLISVSVDAKDEIETSIYYSALPVLYLTSATKYQGVGDDFSSGSMRMQGNDKFADKSQLYNGDIRIKLRGNSTKLLEKRPFHMKLEEKANLLGMGEYKHWALLANYIDHTLMRNKLLYDFSGAIGMDTYMKSENVVLIFNNEYYGVYQLCEVVEIGVDRVDIYDWEESAEDAAKAIVANLEENREISKKKAIKAKEKLETAMCKDLSWITSPYDFTFDVNDDGEEELYTITDYIQLPNATGGALLEMDFFAFDDNKVSAMTSAYSQPIYFKTPEYAITNHSFYSYIHNYLQSFEYALHSTDFIYHDSDIKYDAMNQYGGSENSGYNESDFIAPEYNNMHYSELFDMDSLVQNFIVSEYAMNWDSMKNSVFMYKDTDDLFHIGPEWDFDWAWGNINMYRRDTWYPTSWHTTENAFTREQYYQTVQWNRCLIRDPYFIVRVYEKYKQVRGTLIEDMIKEEGTIDTYSKELETAAVANDAKWGYTYSRYDSVGFSASVKNMERFINTRIDWMDTQFESIDTLISSLGYYKPDDELKVTKIDTETMEGYAVVTAKATNSEIASIVFQVNGTNLYQSDVISGQAICRIPTAVLIKDATVLNVVQILAKDKDGNYIISSQEHGNYRMAKSNYDVFYSSPQVMNRVVDRLEYIIPAVFSVIIFVLAGVVVWINNKKKRYKK